MTVAPMGKLRIHFPRMPAPEFFSEPSHTIRTADGSALLSYDPDTRAGFVYYLTTGVWTISAPVDFTTFALHARLSGHVLIDSDDAKRWMSACGKKESDTKTLPVTTETRH